MFTYLLIFILTFKDAISVPKGSTNNTYNLTKSDYLSLI